MIEKHAFGNFVPPKARFLILGSFTAKQAVKGNTAFDDAYDWFYSNGRNQFWPIIEAVYQRDLNNKHSKQKLFAELGIAMADIILQCERKEGNNLDNNLVNIIYNVDAITKILDSNQIQKIFFSSCFVEKKFRKVFKNIITQQPNTELVTLPSPSPRFAQMSKQQKIGKYRQLLPRLK